ncbi:MAG: tRNA (adenosine(37)-N6)-threonylcarbamoyltransferase complex dimerization subunit type 1 TsaB [Ruminococcus sp.]|nr:tRNA (adenosine(37)-N6)-threonylcarbamoyltransferase complex dimerization subunit type 1 TsaB [Ruminococcus sp.]
MKILALDSSAKACSVAITDDNRILGSFFINTALTHSQTLVPMIDSLLKNTNTDLKEIDRIAVSAGPGSFTGVRIGVSAVKGIAMPSDIPCVSVSTLEAMPYNVIERDAVVCAVMDARCGQVYNALFDVIDGNVTRLCDDRALSIEELGKELKTFRKKIVLVGDGAELCYNSFKEFSVDISLAFESQRYQNAVGVAMAAGEKEIISASELMPSYLRLPQAERELKKKTEGKQ